MTLDVDANLHCLLVQPRFSQHNYWNYVKACELLGASTPAPPLGLLTVAALLPSNWTYELVDLNVGPLQEEHWHRADLVCTGGMLPQQPGILRIVEESKRRGIFVVVGGADPSSQPEIYEAADARVLGEGEASIPIWLESCRNEKPTGLFVASERPSVELAPLPRFDLINFDDYAYVGVQFSRGCPFNCEFCDIIELYGRKPRVKSAEQFIAELDYLYKLGYRGWVDIVDDNFIGNKRFVKRMLPLLKQWCKDHWYPFYFSTEASMNLADDVKLMEMMREVDFRYIFMGIETPDPRLLENTQKSQNTVKPIRERVHKVYQYGMSVSAGYILGFDGEPQGMDRAMIQCIQETGTIMSMVGLLVALPNTQLTSRLLKEQRLLGSDMKLFSGDKKNYRVKTSDSYADGADQTAGGLNFITTRDRVEIFDEYLNVVSTIYQPDVFMERVLHTTRLMKVKRKHIPRAHELYRNVRGMIRLIRWMNRQPELRKPFWRAFRRSLLMGLDKFEFAQTMISTYVHLFEHTRFLMTQIESRKQHASVQRDYPRSLADSAVASPDGGPVDSVALSS